MRTWQALESLLFSFEENVEDEAGWGDYFDVKMIGSSLLAAAAAAEGASATTTVMVIHF